MSGLTVSSRLALLSVIAAAACSTTAAAHPPAGTPSAVPRPASSAAAQPRTTAAVTPRAGRSRTRFVIVFRARAGRIGSSMLLRRYLLTARGPAGPGCAGTGSASLFNPPLDHLEHVALSPPPGGRWCRGAFHGRVTIVLMPVCSVPRRAVACPMFVLDGGVVSRFSFRVR